MDRTGERDAILLRQAARRRKYTRGSPMRSITLRISSSGRLKTDIREGGSIEWSGGGGSNQQAQGITELYTMSLIWRILASASPLGLEVGLLDSVIAQEPLHWMVPALDTVLQRVTALFVHSFHVCAIGYEE